MFVQPANESPLTASVFYDGDYWDKFWLKQEQPDADQKLLPVGCILTMAGTGSEMNAGTVITEMPEGQVSGR
jgi:alcohol dehydrogenase YqhD (iron-dependent ADH family)